MKRVPVLPTIVVALAVAAMVALGIWQLQRRQEKAVAIARLAANVALPPVAFPATSDDRLLFRRSSVACRRLDAIRGESGRDAAGTRGWRMIADCTRADGSVVPVNLGVAREPVLRTTPATGRFAGYVSHAPDHRPLLSALYDRTPKRPMLVVTAPPAGLAANPGPDLSAVPNNHLAYAVQWFLFAAIAAAIYLLALRRRRAS